MEDMQKERLHTLKYASHLLDMALIARSYRDAKTAAYLQTQATRELASVEIVEDMIRAYEIFGGVSTSSEKVAVQGQ